MTASSTKALHDLWRLAQLPEAALSRATLSGEEPALPSSFAVGVAAQSAIAARGSRGGGDRGSARRRQAGRQRRHPRRRARMHRLLLDRRPGAGSLGQDFRALSLRRRRPASRVRPHPRQLRAPSRRRAAACSACRAATRPRRPTSSAHCTNGAHRSSSRPPPTTGWWSRRCAASTNGTRIRRARHRGRNRCSSIETHRRCRADRRCRRWRPREQPLVGHSRARSHAHPRRPGLRPHARGLRRRRDADQLAESAEHRGDCRHQPRQAVGACRSRHRSRPRDTARARARRKCLRARLSSRTALPRAALGRSELADAQARHRLCLARAYGPPRARGRNRRGFDSLVQTATGFNHAEGEAFGGGAARALPMQILDFATGFLMAFGGRRPRCCARRAKAAAGTSASRWRAPACGCASSAASWAAPIRRSPISTR